MKTAPLLLALSMTAAACTEPAPARYEKLSTGWCGCMAPLADLNERAQALMADQSLADSARTAAMTRLFRQMEDAEKAARECATILRDKYGAIKKDDWAEAEPYFWKKCPKLAGQGERLRAGLGE